MGGDGMGFFDQFSDDELFVDLVIPAIMKKFPVFVEFSAPPGVLSVVLTPAPGHPATKEEVIGPTKFVPGILFGGALLVSGTGPTAKPPSPALYEMVSYTIVQGSAVADERRAWVEEHFSPTAPVFDWRPNEETADDKAWHDLGHYGTRQVQCTPKQIQDARESEGLPNASVTCFDLDAPGLSGHMNGVLEDQIIDDSDMQSLIRDAVFPWVQSVVMPHFPGVVADLTEHFNSKKKWKGSVIAWQPMTPDDHYKLKAMLPSWVDTNNENEFRLIDDTVPYTVLRPADSDKDEDELAEQIRTWAKHGVVSDLVAPEFDWRKGEHTGEDEMWWAAGDGSGRLDGLDGLRPPFSNMSREECVERVRIWLGGRIGLMGTPEWFNADEWEIRFTVHSPDQANGISVQLDKILPEEIFIRDTYQEDDTYEVVVMPALLVNLNALRGFVSRLKN